MGKDKNRFVAESEDLEMVEEDVEEVVEDES